MKTLTIRWQRLVNDSGQTCPRCHDTGAATLRAFARLQKALAELDIEVQLQTDALGLPLFTKDPLQSNRIWIAERPLEEWLGAAVGQSPCCAACGDVQCRTISLADTYEAIPEKLIIRAALLAAAELFKDGEP
ncbi:MAG: DUF2703 domain-containing protein [Desulfobulbaceae bacterium]|nr:DUF2703 domain-containing protein [Desulfobulbaceae bacterium]